MITRKNLIDELKNKEYRDAFVSAHVDIGIPHQIRILREQRGLTQQDLADRTGGKQAWIARIENPNYTGFSLKTLKKLASAFDVALIVRFISISELVKWELSLSHEKLEVLGFDDDPYFNEISQPDGAMAKFQTKLPVLDFFAQARIGDGQTGILSEQKASQQPKNNICNYSYYRTSREQSGNKKNNPIQEAMKAA